MKKYDVIIAGGGVSGFAAAIGASQAGARVLLFDRQPSVGGTAVYAMTPVLGGWKADRQGGGVADMLKEYLEERNELIWRGNNADTEEECLQDAMLALLEEAHVDMLFDAELVSAKCADDRICSITVKQNSELLEFAADNFVDATGEAALALIAGALTTVPPVELSMTKTLMFKVRNIRSFDKVSINKRFREKEFPIPGQDKFMGTQLLRDNEANLNLTAVVGDASSPEECDRMYRELQNQVPVIVEWLRKEFPEFAELEVVRVAPILGVRYTRSIVSRRQLVLADMQNSEPPPEPVGFCGSYIGGHYINGYSSPWGHVITGRPAIPYGSLRSANINNLLACGRIIDVDPRVISAVRLCVNCISSGQAAGIAAALDIPDYEVLAEELKRQKCLIQ